MSAHVGVSIHRKICGSPLQQFMLLIFIIPIIAAAPSNLARIIGPLMGKRGDAEGYENDVINRVHAVQEKESDLLSRIGVDGVSRSCPLDTLFLSLEPQWQDAILHILRLASYEDGWKNK